MSKPAPTLADLVDLLLDPSSMSDEEVQAELAARGVDVDEACARIEAFTARLRAERKARRAPPPDDQIPG